MFVKFQREAREEGERVVGPGSGYALDQQRDQIHWQHQKQDFPPPGLSVGAEDSPAQPGGVQEQGGGTGGGVQAVQRV